MTLKDALRRYLLSLEASRYSRATVRLVEVVAGRLLEHADAMSWPAAPEISAGHIEEWFAAIQREGSRRSRRPTPLSATTLDDYYRTLHAWFAWLVARGHTPKNPLDAFRKPRAAPRVVPIYTDDQLDDFLKLCDPRLYELQWDRWTAFRDRALVFFVIDTPARRGELEGMTVERVDLSEGLVRVVGKGDSEREMAFGPATGAALADWLEARVAAGPLSGSVWINMQGGPLGGDAIYRIFRRLGERAGIPGASVHRFRHTFAMRWLRAGANERYLRSVGGWRRIPDTYFRTLSAEEAQAAHRELGPADQFAHHAGLRRRGRGRR